MWYSDTGRTHQVSPSSILYRFVNCKPSTSFSQPVDIKVVYGASIELRELSGPPQRSVVLGFVDRVIFFHRKGACTLGQCVNLFGGQFVYGVPLGNLAISKPYLETSSFIYCLLTRIQLRQLDQRCAVTSVISKLLDSFSPHPRMQVENAVDAYTRLPALVTHLVHHVLPTTNDTAAASLYLKI